MSIPKTDPRAAIKNFSAPQLGRFDDDRREYVIANPCTPYPWINYLGNQEFLSLISNTGGGYAFYRDAKLRRLTRYRYNNVPLDSNGRYFYLVDGDTVWSPGYKPVRTQLDDYSCRHGMGYTVITGVKDQLEAEALFFVPQDTTAEVHRLTLSNHSSKTKSVKLFSFIEWCLWNAEDDAGNFQRNFSTGEVQVEGSVIYHKTEYRERRNHFAFYSVNRPVTGFDTDRDTFVGLHNGLEAPQAVMQGAPGNSIAYGWAPIASHYLELELAPGQEETLVFVLGYCENKDEEKWLADGSMNTAPAQVLIERFASEEAVEEALAELRQHWEKQFSTWVLQSEEPELNRMVSTWNQYQCVVTFNLSRSASLFESGVSRGMGFRDSNQDLLGCIQLFADRARQRILDIAATQFSDGSAYHQYQPLTKQGNAAIGSGFNDDPLWLVASTAAFVKETGDLSLLDEPVPFDDKPDSDITLMDHLTASMHHVVNNRGPHGLPLIGRADWNDCMNLNVHSTDPDESYQVAPLKTGGVAESLMIAGLFGWVGPDYIELCERTGRSDEVAWARTQLATMAAAVAEHGWDGRWYLRAYRHDGEKVGSSECAEGQIFVESQGWCIMGGNGLEDGRAETALDSVEALLGCEHGVVVLYPVFTKYYPELGEISSYPDGYKENGSVFCHTNPWIMIGETMIGRGEKAMDYYRRTAPAYRQHLQELHKIEPYVYPQMIAGKQAKVPGEAKNSWLTGTAAWSFYAVTQYILGVRPDFDGLRIDPCIPPSWRGFTATRSYRGATYEIEVRNPEHVSRGVREVTVDGEPVEGNLLPVFDAGTRHKVEVVLG